MEVSQAAAVDNDDLVTQLVENLKLGTITKSQFYAELGAIHRNYAKPATDTSTPAKEEAIVAVKTDVPLTKHPIVLETVAVKERPKAERSPSLQSGNEETVHPTLEMLSLDSTAPRKREAIVTSGGEATPSTPSSPVDVQPKTVRQESVNTTVSSGKSVSAAVVKRVPVKTVHNARKPVQVKAKSQNTTRPASAGSTKQSLKRSGSTGALSYATQDASLYSFTEQELAEANGYDLPHDTDTNAYLQEYTAHRIESRSQAAQSRGRSRQREASPAANQPKRRPASASRSSNSIRSGDGAPFLTTEMRAASRSKRASYTEEYTFRPEIHELPDGCVARYDNSVPFYDRAMLWHMRREIMAHETALVREQAALEECTFRPQLNPTSVAISDDSTTPMWREMQQKRSQMKARQLRMQVQQEREAQFRQDCTFQPAINANSKQMAPTGRIRSNSAPAKRRAHAQHQQLSEECTFAPQTNALQKEMQTARLYLTQDPFERLSRPSLITRQNVAVENVCTNPSSPKSACCEHVKAEKFNEFLERQSELIARKHETKERIIDDLTKDWGQPILNRLSLAMIEDDSVGGPYRGTTFMQRVEMSSRKKNQPHISSDLLEPQCTFTPAITAKAKKLQPRTPQELCDGDQAKRDQKIKDMIWQSTAEELQQVTLKPQLKSSSAIRARVPSKLQLKDDPDHYVERLKAKMDLEERLRREAYEAKLMEESKECTFKPEVRDAPDFVKRIADSHRLVKSMRPAPQPERPDWR